MELYPSPRARSSSGPGGRLRELSWLSQTSLLLERHCKFGESLLKCSLDLGIPLETAEARIRETKNLAQLPIALKFESKVGSDIKYPSALVHTHSRNMADLIARQLSKLAKREPLLVESAVNTFVENIQESHLLMLTWRDWLRADTEEGRVRIARFRDLVHLVPLLKIPELTVQLVAYSCDRAPHHLLGKLERLGLPRSTKPHLIKPRNAKCRRNHEHLGIRIGCYHLSKKAEKQMHASEAFRYVMALAAICKSWQPATKKESIGSVDPFVESPFLVGELPLAAKTSPFHGVTATRGNSTADGPTVSFNSQENTSGADQLPLSWETRSPIAAQMPERERRNSDMQSKFE
jgi:hypothetical protein